MYLCVVMHVNVSEYVYESMCIHTSGSIHLYEYMCIAEYV